MTTLLVLLLASLPSLALVILLRQQRQHYRALLNDLEVGVLHLSRSGTVRWHNSAAASLLGCSTRPLLGEYLHERLPQLTSGQRMGQVKGDDGLQRTLQASNLNGSAQLLQIRSVLPEVECFQRSQYFARIGTWDWDIDTNRLYWSEAIYGMFGYKVDEITPSYERFCASVHPDDRERIRAGELQCIESGENHDEEYRVVWPDGSVHWLRETGNVVKDAQGKSLKMIGVVRDITEEKARASHMHQLAHHDALTGLPNRLLFEDRLRQALDRARRSGKRVALVFIDLDGFKAINDTFGHQAGDQVLISTAQRLQTALRSSDSVARLGGDEFVVILEELAIERSLDEEARSIADKLLQRICAPLSIAGETRCIAASLGIAVYPDHAGSMDPLIHSADLAMYEAKRSGENQYRLGSQGQARVSVD